jgi:hypothetical protein
MALYEMTTGNFLPIGKTSFADMKVGERTDIQRLLRTQINVLEDDLYVLTEEFGDWADSKRRIDLLAIDKQANLVVIELKRTQDGGHMELQAIRYASMVSAMTFERAEQIHADFLTRIGQPATEAQSRLLEFLNWEAPNEDSFAEEVRILLVSEDFGKELTTAVLWLRDHDIDIRCVRLRPYLHGTSRLIDVQQIIPLPEAQEYQIQLREKEQLERKQKSQKEELRYRFWQGVIACARTHGTRHANITPSFYHWLGASSGIRGLGLNYVAVQDYCDVELYIDRGEGDENKRIFDELMSRSVEIDAAFGEALSWERLDDKRACRIKHVLQRGSFLSPESEWPKIQEAMVDAMTRLENALTPALDLLKL